MNNTRTDIPFDIDHNSLIFKIGAWAIYLITIVNLMLVFFFIFSFASGKIGSSQKKQSKLTKKDISELSKTIGRVSPAKALSCNELCPICLLEYENFENLLQLPGCSHTYHSKCILTWLDKEDTCPNCRSVIKIQPSEAISN